MGMDEYYMVVGAGTKTGTDTDKASAELREKLLEALPKRVQDSNKGTYGRLLVIAGSDGMAGAAVLSAEAAYRTGCGLVYVLTPEENRVVIQTKLPEAVYLRRDEDLGKKLSEKYSAAILGPGLGTGKEALNTVLMALRTLNVPIVIDADALNLAARFSEVRDAVRNYSHGIIMTPHLLEAARLLGKSLEDLPEERREVARRISEKYNCVCVAKSANTVCYAPDRDIFTCLVYNDGLATGGSGDVLAGIIGGFLAQDSSDIYKSAVLGVSVHSLAGKVAAGECGERYMLAGDIIRGMRDVLKGETPPEVTIIKSQPI